MFIELIDSLRCTNDHADSWLVASILTRDGRFILEGSLGCPVCSREYPIVRGVAWFGAAPRPDSPSAEAGGSDTDESEEAMRIGAFLSVTEGVTVALCGTWAAQAPPLARLIPLRIFAVNPTALIEESESVGIVESTEGLPFAQSLFQGVALDAATAGARTVASAVHTLAEGGRLVAPASVDVPPEISILARDDHFWVGEKERSLVVLKRG